MNEVMMQYFEWYLESDGKHWERLAQDAPHLASLGIRKVWMPPAFKGTSEHDVGYGVYDLYDLGEFDQKGTVRTKYGTKSEYLAAIESLKANGIAPIADIVLNHKASADKKERFLVFRMDPLDRRKPISRPYEIEGWTQFTFDGRNNQYSDFKWHWYHFSGTDYDALRNENGIYMILGNNKGWADDDTVDSENGNYDYLMYADIDYRHPDVVKHTHEWLKWYVDTTGVSGLRLDAVKHIDYQFMSNLIREAIAQYGDDFYVFGEYWKANTDATEDYLADIEYTFDLVDVVLHMNFFEAGQQGDAYDLRTLLDGSLMKLMPTSAVTFVDNHDTQRGQALQSTVEEWFKPLAYATILLREEGLPCLFYGDYYGIQGEFSQQGFQNVLDKLLMIRQQWAYGTQEDYFDHPNCIGWVRKNEENVLAVVLNNGDATMKRMCVGAEYAQMVFVDCMWESNHEVLIDDDGWGEFPVETGNLSVWKNK